ncbi:MAG: AMP-binding protein [Verrucomicrobia bacterium]|nr:AMP-binding protein [Verrucomicrobiota bacterium]
MPIVQTNTGNESSSKRQIEIDASFVTRFEEQVSHHQHRLAVQDGKRVLNYAELNQSANQIAFAILDRIGTGNRPVATLLPLGAPFICATWGIWKAGKIAAPGAPSQPEPVIVRILNDVGPGLLLCDSSTLALAMRLIPQGTKLVNVDEIESTQDMPNPNQPVAPDDLAMIVYTSGSSGLPRGVVHDHRTYLQSVRCLTERLNIQPEDRLSMLHPPGSVSAQGSILCALLSGASVHPYDVAQNGLIHLGQWLREARITFLRCIPTLFRSLTKTLPHDMLFPDIRICWLGGESVTAQDVDLWRKHFPVTSTFINNIGTTETLSFAQYALRGDSSFEGDQVPIGYEHKDKVVTVRNHNGIPVPDGAIGEIAVESRFLARGYWNRPELTHSQFQQSAAGGDCRIYFTGDFGKRRNDGCLVYAGRRDDQVKIRGFRVQMAGVESVIRKMPMVDNVGVVLRNDHNGDDCLVAYLVEQKEGSLQPSILRNQLRKQLPEYMVPSQFVVVDSLPLTATGKIDRRALPDLPGTPAKTCSVNFQTDDIEHRVAAIWKNTLNISHVRGDDSFFDLGGDSLHAMQLLADISHEFDNQLPVSALLNAPTITAMTRLIRTNAAWGSFSPLVVLQEGGPAAPLFLVPPAASSVLGFRALVEQLGTDRPRRPSLRHMTRRLYYRTMKLAAKGYRRIRPRPNEHAGRPIEATRSGPPSGLKQATRNIDIRRAHGQARGHYIPHHYPGRITYFKTASCNGMRDKWLKGWSRLCDEIVFVDISGEHITALENDHVPKLASALRQCLRGS